LVFHENPKVILKLFGQKSFDFFNQIDYLGFRFEEMRNAFVDIFGKSGKLFICPSGIPEQYVLSNVPAKKFKNKKISVCFVGMLIPLKNIDIILEAINLAFPDRNFDLKIFGEGMLKNQLEKRIKELNLEDCVSIQGKVSRDEIQIALTDIDVFVMVSKPEAFGLVYVEAMGKGCITIGTKGQGIDGIIKNNENGFLCEARNIEELKSLFEYISSMRYEDKIFMADKALETASGLTDRKVAISYLEKIEAL
jgi:L-malate glycosyltransferase